MSIRIALAGNPNSGKTTLFNALTGSNQFVGNWPGVTVEKKEGRLKGNNDVSVTDLPGIYSLSPYTPEEVIARTYLVNERPDVILNIVDGTNLERNLYLSTQLSELGIPMVIAVNMMDIVRKNGDRINISELSRSMDCKVVEISALKNQGVTEAANEAIKAANDKARSPAHVFSGCVEHAVAHIEEAALHSKPEAQQRWYAIKIFERDNKVLEELALPSDTLAHIEKDIRAAETELGDDAESIITNERYVFIGSVIRSCLKKRSSGGNSVSDRIDRIVTNRWLGLPIFALIMFTVYFLAMAPDAPGTKLTDWANDGLFGDGFHLFGIGASAYEEASGSYGDAMNVLDAFIGMDDGSSVDTITAAFDGIEASATADYVLMDEETLSTEEVTYSYNDLQSAVETYTDFNGEEPDPASYGVWVPSIPNVVDSFLTRLNCAEWLHGLIMDGIIAGVGAVLGFVPQMLVLFFLLAFLESCGYMARIAFVLDRVFRRFGLSGKSFIPMLVGTGCGVPGIMASRTIENERDRRMTVMTTTFIPCGAKLPFIAMISGALFGGSALISVSAYFVGMASVIVSGLMLKKTRMFAGEPAPFVMELPAYHLPTLSNLLRSMWERGWSFIKKAGTIILLSTVLVWFTTYFGVVDGSLRMLDSEELSMSLLARFGNLIAWVFAPLGFGNWQSAVASITGLIAKENIVGTMGILYGSGDMSTYTALAQAFTGVSGYAFLMFNLLCAPCFAAIGAIRREMNSPRWTCFAIAYQCGFAYAVALMINQFGSLFRGNVNIIGVIFAFAVLLSMFYMLFIRKYRDGRLQSV